MGCSVVNDGPGEDAFLVIGRIVKPHGVRGEVSVEVLTDTPERYTWLERVFVGRADPTPVVVEGVRFHQSRVLLKLAGYDSREAVADLRSAWLQVPVSEGIPLEEGEYYLYQAIGLEVVTTGGERLGRVKQILETGANNVFVIDGEGREILLPDIDTVVKDIDFAAGRMTVELMSGLLD
ncbi:MAG: ribosome maturation factor RimM [Candidatus Promineifilaceae bacterium]|nr:ribosome maturation factor RimM [Candidatus Promineifilaceae bacterium]